MRLATERLHRIARSGNGMRPARHCGTVSASSRPMSRNTSSGVTTSSPFTDCGYHSHDTLTVLIAPVVVDGDSLHRRIARTRPSLVVRLIRLTFVDPHEDFK